MNYGKENLDKRKKNISSKKNMKKKRVGVRFFKALVICVLLIAVIGAGGVGLFVKKIIDDAPKVTPNMGQALRSHFLCLHGRRTTFG